ncbi:MAG: NADH:flavin oxidoreductase/NADH oxidase [Bdellovibrionales bacterium]
MSGLFTALTLRETEFKNRIFLSPMCQYSSVDGVPNDWHFVHLGSRAVGGVALVMVEATSVCPEGRITRGDTGIWNEEQAQAFARITGFVKAVGARVGIQLAHAGRKASTAVPWEGGGPLSAAAGGWMSLGPSNLPFHPSWPQPREMTEMDISKVIGNFAEAAKRSLAAGFEVVEIHMAHGYLLHEFLSPLSNLRQDRYGGDLEGRMRLPLEVAHAVRSVWPSHLPVFVRISATDWMEGGWTLEHSLELCARLRDAGVDLIDCSSGGAVPEARIPLKPGYQVPFAERIRKEVGVATGAVGMIEKAQQAEEILTAGKADAIFLARELLRRPYWPLHAAHTLGAPIPWPKPYERGKI